MLSSRLINLSVQLNIHDCWINLSVSREKKKSGFEEEKALEVNINPSVFSCLIAQRAPV